MPTQLWHIPFKIDAESQMPSDWQGSVADWVMAEIAAHAGSITLTADQFASLTLAAPVSSAAAPHSADAAPEAFDRVPAFEAPDATALTVLPEQSFGDFHGLVVPHIA